MNRYLYIRCEIIPKLTRLNLLLNLNGYNIIINDFNIDFINYYDIKYVDRNNTLNLGVKKTHFIPFYNEKRVKNIMIVVIKLQIAVT